MRVYVRDDVSVTEWVSRKDIVIFVDFEALLRKSSTRHYDILKCIRRAKGVIVIEQGNSRQEFTDFVVRSQQRWVLAPSWWRRRKQVVFATSDIGGLSVWNTNPWPRPLPKVACHWCNRIKARMQRK